MHSLRHLFCVSGAKSASRMRSSEASGAGSPQLSSGHRRDPRPNARCRTCRSGPSMPATPLPSMPPRRAAGCSRRTSAPCSLPYRSGRFPRNATPDAPAFWSKRAARRVRKIADTDLLSADIGLPNRQPTCRGLGPETPARLCIGSKSSSNRLEPGLRQ